MPGTKSDDRVVHRMSSAAPKPAAISGAPPRWLDSRRAKVLACATGASFMIMLDSNIVGVSLASISRDLHAPFTDIEWVVSGYILTFASLLMSAGAIADRYGRRQLLVIGIVIFTLASLACGLAPTASLLNWARALQGVGAAIQLSATLAVLGHEFRGPDRARAFGIWGMVMGIAVAAGPLVGGLITSGFGWRWSFLVNVPFGIVLVALAAKAVENSRDPDATRLDVAGILTFGTGLALLVWGLINASVDGWSSQVTLFRFAGSVGALALFVMVELMQKRPMIDFSLFRKQTFLGGAVAMVGFASAAQVMMTYLPLYLQNVFAFNPALAGVAMLPFAVPLFIFPRIAANLATKVSGRAILTLGLVIVAVGNFVTAGAAAGQASYLITAVGMVLTGCGAGLLNSETAKVLMSVIPPERAGMASGISATLRFVGLVTSVSGLGAVLSAFTQKQFQGLSPDTSVAIASSSSDVKLTIARIVAGDIQGAAAALPDLARATFVEISRAAFASGFSVVLSVAGVVAMIAALLTYLLVSASVTAPHRPAAEK